MGSGTHVWAVERTEDAQVTIVRWHTEQALINVIGGRRKSLCPEGVWHMRVKECANDIVNGMNGSSSFTILLRSVWA